MAVYFIRNPENGYIKIGRSNDPEARLKQLQTACPHKLELLGVLLGPRNLESKVHELFGEYRVRGEWFEGHSTIIKFIEFWKGHPDDSIPTPMVAGVFYIEAECDPGFDRFQRKRVRLCAIAPTADPFSGPEFTLADVAQHFVGSGFRVSKVELVASFDLYHNGLKMVYGGTESEYRADPDDVSDTPTFLGSGHIPDCWVSGIANLASQLRAAQHRVDAMEAEIYRLKKVLKHYMREELGPDWETSTAPSNEQATPTVD